MSAVNIDESNSAAALAKIKAETDLIRAQTKKLRAENDRMIQIELSKTLAETDKIRTETEKVRSETRYYPLVALSAIAVAALTFFGAVLVKLLHP